MQTALSMIWTWLIDSVFHEDNRYALLVFSNAQQSSDLGMHFFLFQTDPIFLAGVSFI